MRPDGPPPSIVIKTLSEFAAAGLGYHKMLIYPFRPSAQRARVQRAEPTVQPSSKSSDANCPGFPRPVHSRTSASRPSCSSASCNWTYAWADPEPAAGSLPSARAVRPSVTSTPGMAASGTLATRAPR